MSDEFGVDPDKLGMAAEPFGQLAADGEQLSETMASELAGVHPYPVGKENDPTVRDFAQWYEKFKDNMSTVGGQLGGLLKTMSATVESASRQSAQGGAESAAAAQRLRSGGG